MRLNDLNPYSLDANGWCDPTNSRADAYERDGPPPDTRATDEKSAGELARRLAALRRSARRPIAVEKLYRHWAEHPRRDVVRELFPMLKGTERRAALRREVGRVRVRSTSGHVVDLATKVRECDALTPLESQRIVDVLVDLRHAWKTRDADAGYDDINWRHAVAEIGQILDIAEQNGLTPVATEDAVLASMFSDAAKLKGNFLTHHIDGAVAAALVLPRFVDVEREGGRARVVAICQAILEHQVGPPRFMAQMVRMGIEEAARQQGFPLDGLEGLHAKIADPFNPDHLVLHADGYGVLKLDERERALLAHVGLDAWYGPHPSTPWFAASSAVIDADSLVNYVTPDGVGKIVAICGPGTPFRDPTVFHSIFSCGASFVDAVSVMSDVAMPAVREGVAHTRSVIEDVRARVSTEIDEGWLHFSPRELKVIASEEAVDLDKLVTKKRDGEVLVDVPWLDGGHLPYWNTQLDYAADGASFEFAKLLRRRVADLLRET
ncbi:MAG: hypothetical protein A2138_14375 [Deltaproteobacteria bacterium RBG_16_71_12]|nr:MAG: hypothetical protein A2138_14375 [Deltaproteobacteria bacterium RBG_16_71_12]